MNNTHPSNLKVRRLTELPDLPQEEVGESVLYATANNKDYKINSSTYVDGLADAVEPEIERIASTAAEAVATDIVEAEVQGLRDDLVDVAFSGSYDDLIDKPAIPELPMTGALTDWVSHDLNTGTYPVISILGIAHGQAVGVTESGSLRLSDDGINYGPIVAPSATLPWVTGGNSRIFELDDGEVLLIAESGTSLWKSTGWPSPTDWTKVHEAGTYGANSARFHQGWGVRVAGQYVLAAEYGNPKPNAHRAYLSSDYGQTFATVFDQRDHQVVGSSSNAHLHGCCIDPWGPNGPRLWVMTADSPFDRLWWTDDLTGSSWTPVADADYDVLSSVADIADPQDNEQPPPGYVVIDATPWGLVVGQDDFPEGTAYIPRDESYVAAPQVKTSIKFPERLPTLMYVAQDQAIVGEWVFTLHSPSGNVVSDGKALVPARITAVSARTGDGAIVWEGTEDLTSLIAIDVFADSLWVRHAVSQRTIQIPLNQGGAVRQLPDTSVSSARETSAPMVMAIGSNAEARVPNSTAIGPYSVARDGQQMVIAPHATVRGTASVVIGPTVPAPLAGTSLSDRAVVLGYRAGTGEGEDSIALGTLANAEGVTSVALGSQSNANGGSVAIGSGSEAHGTHALALGRNASVSQSRAIAIGTNANASGLHSVAIGNTADSASSRSVAIGSAASANNGDSVALGDGAETTQSFQVAVGARYFEMGVFSSNRLAPPADRAALWVHDNDGTFELRVRRPDNTVERFVPGEESAADADAVALARVQELRNDLANPTGGAALVAYDSSKTVKAKLDELVVESDEAAGYAGQAAASASEAATARDAAEDAADAASQSENAAAASMSTASTKADEAAASASAASTARDAATYAATLGPVKGYATRAEMEGNTGEDEGALALITNDPSPENNGTWRWDGSAWVQATSSIPDKSIGPRQLAILTDAFNLIVKDRVMPNKTVNSTTGELDDSTISSTSTFVSVSPLEKLVSKDIFRGGFYDAGFNFISAYSSYAEIGDLTAPANAAYVRFSFDSVNIDTAQVNRGETLLPYDDGNYGFDPNYPVRFPPPADGTVGTPQLIDKAVTAGKTDFILDSPNLVNPDEVTLGKNINSTTGELSDWPSTDVTGFIPVVPAEDYTGRVARVAWYGEDKSFILSYGRDGTAASVFTAPANAAFVRVVIPIALRDEWRINEGDTFLPYEPYGLRLDPSIRVEGVAPDPGPGPEPGSLPYAFTADPVPDYYVPADDLPYGELATNRATTSVQDVYSRYAALASAFPDYVSGVNLGPDQSGNYSVYRYTLSPFVVPSNLTKPLPRIAIVSGTHGAEKNSQFSLYHFLYDLCHNWRDNPALEYLRWGVIIDLIPCANPWAFENGEGRKNSRGVDLNRNMDAGWSFNPDPNSNTYAGTEPFSEIESQYIRDFIDDNLDALFIGDYHNHSTQPPEYFLWHALETGFSGNEALEVFSSTVIRKCTLNIAERYELDVPLTSGVISYATPNGKVRDYAAQQGVPGATLECFPRLDQSDYPTSIQASTEYTGNVFLHVMGTYKDRL